MLEILTGIMNIINKTKKMNKICLTTITKIKKKCQILWIKRKVINTDPNLDNMNKKNMKNLKFKNQNGSKKWKNLIKKLWIKL